MVSRSFIAGVARHVLALLLVGLLAGCAATFRAPHGEVMGNSLRVLPNQVAAAQLAQDTYERIPAEKTAHLLFAEEAARLYSVAAEHQRSQELFAEVIAAYKENENEALITATETAGQAAAGTIANDRLIPYEGAAFERIFAHQFQSMNYLLLGNTDAALIEMRAGATQQRFATQRFEKESQEAEDEQASARALIGEDHYGSLGVISSDGRNRFENAYYYAYAGVLREATGDKNGAFIDYRKTLTIQPNNPFIRRFAARHAAAFDPGNVAGYAEGVPTELTIHPRLSKAQVVVFAERGWIQPMAEIRFDVQTLEGGYLAIALPAYTDTAPDSFRAVGVTASLDGERRTTEALPLTTTLPLAQWRLRQRYPAIIARQVARAITKTSLNNKTAEKFNEDLDAASAALYLFTNVANTLSERADTRAWLSLPQRIDMVSFDADPGNQSLEFAVGGASTSLDVDLAPDSITIIRLIDANDILQAHVLLSR